MKVYDNIALFGCKATTAFMLRSLCIDHPIRHIITIDPAAGEKHKVADYADLSELAAEKGICLYTAKYYSLKHASDLEYIRSLGIDIAFVIGWQRLIPAEILDSLTIGAFGMHGSSMDLPLGRGRSPMNWSLIEGRKAFYTNLFRYDAGVDSGAVVDTLKFQVTSRDTAETLHFKNALAMKHLIEKNAGRLVRNAIAPAPQNSSITPTYYPKRTPDDSLIDWNLDVFALDRFIRAVTRPFNGAFSFLGDRKMHIYDAQVFDMHEFGFDDVPVGQVVTLFENGKFLIKAYGGLLLVNEYTYSGHVEEGMVFHDNELAHKVFSRNPQGNFDVVA